MKKEVTIQLASVPDRDSLVAEIWIGDNQLAELYEVEGRISLEIYPNLTGESLIFDLDDLINKLLLAKSKLVET